MSDEIKYAPLEPRPPAPASDPDLHHLHDVPVELAVEIGRTHMTIGETLKLGPGSIVSLNRLAGEPVDLLVNGKPIARGEVVVIDEEFGLRITDVVAAAGRLYEAEAAAHAPLGAATQDPALMSEEDVAAYLGGGESEADAAYGAGAEMNEDDVAAYLGGGLQTDDDVAAYLGGGVPGDAAPEFAEPLGPEEPSDADVARYLDGPSPA